jgi:DNA-directed RNA polymerase subunit RPC12/RpoP
LNITYFCPSCDRLAHREFDSSTQEIACPECGGRVTVPADAVEGSQLRKCLVCPSTDLYVRKDFPQRLGVAIVVVGVVGSSIAWYYANLPWTFGILFATALADFLLYALVGNALMCYRCNAIYRGVAEMESHGDFDLETHERFRQLAARLDSRPQN